jgi:hypothetical protein
LAGEFVRGLHEMVARERHLFSGDGLLAVTVIEDNLRSTLDQQYLRAAGRLVERRHELVLRFERNGVNPRVSVLFSLPIHPELSRKRIERAFGRIAFHLPDALLMEQLRVIAEHRHAPQTLQDRVLPDCLSILLDSALRCIAITGDPILRFRGDGGDDHHFHER